MPLLIGETGGTTEGRDRAWAEAALTYFEAHGFGLFWYCLNPNSDDMPMALKNHVQLMRGEAVDTVDANHRHGRRAVGCGDTVVPRARRRRRAWS